ncbi:hypothetical protein Ddye_023108 [Dipteronia dyeriana]|uniref:Uncharacterized protein n=1 Tax=Dipteronia dyeriana TaxID=168575 RepID=A0AAD9TSB5_9ROSI|nr:hypothetical protein Ddye_023108 [Dipteronia dyeriana]
MKIQETKLNKRNSSKKQVLAREMDLESFEHVILFDSAKKALEFDSEVTELDKLIATLQSATDACERCFETENAADVLMGISKELLGRLQIGKLIILSEANAGLDEELSYLRDRLECLEAALHQAEETKMATDIRAKVITNLVMQLAFQIERLHQQKALLVFPKSIPLFYPGRPKLYPR